MLFQAALVLFAIVVILRTYGQYKKELVSKYWLVAFSLVWTIVIIAALAPKVADRVAQFVGVERGVDLFVYIAVLVLVYVVYRLLVRVQHMHQEITELVRQIALTHAKTPLKKEDSGNGEMK